MLNNITLDIPANKTLAFFGLSGSGKSTIVQLIQRFYDPTAGAIQLDGHDIKTIGVDYLRTQMAIVSQEPVLFDASIRQNIRLGRLDASDAEIEEVAKQANAHQFIMNLENKYDTNVGERGTHLSCGQKQKICIARALIRNPKILILDEPTSALDLESEDNIQEALDKARNGRTTIIIAHRLRTIRNADIIVGINNGNISEMGTHEELMNKKQFYYELNMKDIKNNDDDEHSESNSDSDESVKGLKRKLPLLSFNEPDELVEKQETDEVISLKKKQKLSVKKLLTLLKFIWKFHVKDLWRIIFACFAEIIANGCIVACLYISAEFFRILTIIDPVDQRNQSYIYGCTDFGIALVSIFANMLSSYYFSCCNANLVQRVRENMFESSLRQEIGWHDLSENRATLLSTKLSSTAQFCNGTTTDALRLIVQIMSGLGAAVIISIILNWELALTSCCFSIGTLVAKVLHANMSHISAEDKETDEEIGGKMMIQCTENIKTVASLGRQTYFKDKFDQVFEQSFTRKLKRVFVQALCYGCLNAMPFFSCAILYKLGADFIKDNRLTLSDLFRIGVLIGSTTDLLSKNIILFPDVNKAIESVKIAYCIISRQSKIDGFSENGLKPDDIKGKIEFHDVQFCYPTRNNAILKGLSVKIGENCTTAFVGQSGCGKTTATQLLLRFYDADQGKITIDGIDIRDFNVKWLRSKISIVSQEPLLFNTTIFENIKYGSSTEENVVKVFFRTNIKGFLNYCPFNS